MQLDERLSAAASFARKGKRFADIGTDHAYIPIYLVENGISIGGVASDINQGPVDRANTNISEAGLSKLISVVKTDGLNGIDEYKPDDVFVLGMGGELISSIVSSADFVKNPNIRLILQPMTHAEEVRRMLYQSGFNIIGEKITRDGHRFYQIIAAEYDGIVREKSETELIIGEFGMKCPNKITFEYIEYLISVNDKKIAGIKQSGADISSVEKMNDELKMLLLKK